MKILFPTLALLLFIATTSADDIKCECTISNVAFLYFRWQKTCTAKASFKVTKADTTVTSLNGNSSTNEPNKDVSFFYAFGRTVEYIPKGLDTVFANLTGMRFELTKLKHVTKKNFEPFPQLLMFASVSNQIQFIEKDLFVNNPNLKYVSFRSNKITFIDPAVFDHVKSNLVQLYLDGTAIACGFPQATTNNAVGKVLDKLVDSACGNIDNAPPLYSFWLAAQGGSEDNNSCTDDLEQCNRDMETVKIALKCVVAPGSPGCPSPDQIRSLIQSF